MPSSGGIRRDRPAVANGLTLVYSSGTAEGTIRRVKALKRQMSGRANRACLGGLGMELRRDGKPQPHYTLE